MNYSRWIKSEMNGWSSSPSSSRGRREANLARAEGVEGELPGHRRDLAMGANGRGVDGKSNEGRGAAGGGPELRLRDRLRPPASSGTARATLLKLGREEAKGVRER